jgi:hypothetical protein
MRFWRWQDIVYPSRTLGRKRLPAELRGTEIPIEGRVMAVVDVYDAITTRTLYRSPMSYD